MEKAKCSECNQLIKSRADCQILCNGCIRILRDRIKDLKKNAEQLEKKLRRKKDGML